MGIELAKLCVKESIAFFKVEYEGLRAFAQYCIDLGAE